MKNYTRGLSILLLTSLMFTGCESKESSHANGANMESMIQKSERISSETVNTFFEGTLVGTEDGKPFTEKYGKNMLGYKLRTRGSDVALDIGSRKMGTITIKPYRGTGKYTANDLFFIIVKMDYKTGKVSNPTALEKKVEVTEDTDTHIKGTVSFKTKSSTDETHTFQATFTFKKIAIDPNDKQALLKMITINDDYMSASSLDLRKDKDFMLQAIAIKGNCFSLAHESLKKDKAFILRTVQERSGVVVYLKMANSPLLKDKDFVIKLLKVNKNVIHFLPEEMQKNKDVIAASKKDL